MPCGPLLEAAWRDDAAGGLLRAEPHDLPVAVAVGQLLPRRRVGPPRRRAGRRRAAQRAVGAGRRRLRAAPALRRRSVPARGALGPASRVDHHPAADVRPRGRRARPARDAARRRAGRRGPSAGWSSSCTGAAAAAGGLVELCHPWESGCDDSPRWDDAVPGGRTPAAWFDARASWSPRSSGRRAARRSTTRRSRSARSASARSWRGTPSSWRRVTGDDDLAAACRGSWPRRSTRAGTPSVVTWVDDGPTAAGSGRIRTLDALLPSLLHPRAEVFGALVDPAAYGAPCGPRGVHADEPTYEPATYWRGPAWPQLTYLLWLAATSSGSDAAGSALVRSMRGGRGALRVRGVLGGRHRRAARRGAPDLVDARAGHAGRALSRRGGRRARRGAGSARAPRRRRRRSR